MPDQVPLGKRDLLGGIDSVLVTAVASRLVAETDREMYLSLLTDRASKAGVTPEMAFEFS